MKLDTLQKSEACPISRTDPKRDLALVVVMLAAFFMVIAHPVEKAGLGQKVDLASLVPDSFDGWESKTYDTSGYRDQWQSINTLLVRRYFKENLSSLRGTGSSGVIFILEHSSDLRQNFGFHFPENCHRAGGNPIEYLKPLTIDLGEGALLKAKSIFIKGLPGSAEPSDKIVSYWLVIGKKQLYKTFFIKLDQMVSGLLSQAKQGFLVRVDSIEGFEYTPEGLEKANRVSGEFIKDLYYSLSSEKRKMLFGAALA